MESWFIQKVNSNFSKDLMQFLYQDGVIRFRWVDFLLGKEICPEKVTKSYSSTNAEADAELYLMHTIAIGEDAIPFFGGPGRGNGHGR